MEASLEFRYRNRRTKFDSNGNPGSTEERVYRVYPLEGEQFFELAEVDGKPPTEEERKKESQRREKSRRERAKRAASEESDDDDVGFSRELVDRYTTTVEGTDEINGRRTYVLRFEPREGELPARRRIDHALNNSAGRLWIDAEEFGIARVEFDLRRAVRFWGGVVGVLRAMVGRIEFLRLENGWWHPRHMELRMDGRVLWNSLNQKMVMDWLDIRPAAIVTQDGNQ